LFDTNILIDCLSGVPAAKKEIDCYKDKAISIITWMEVMIGAAPEDVAATRAYLMTFLNLPLTVAIADRAVILRKKRRFKLPDAIIMATADVEGRLFITRNTRDFPVDDPGVRIPYQI